MSVCMMPRITELSLVSVPRTELEKVYKKCVSLFGSDSRWTLLTVKYLQYYPLYSSVDCRGSGPTVRNYNISSIIISIIILRQPSPLQCIYPELCQGVVGQHCLSVCIYPVCSHGTCIYQGIPVTWPSPERS